MKTEDTALAFASIIALIISFVPQIAAAVPPQYSISILALGAILKAVAEKLKDGKAMAPEDVALAFVAILTIAINIIPTLAENVSPQESIAILALGATLKAILKDIQPTTPPA